MDHGARALDTALDTAVGAPAEEQDAGPLALEILYREESPRLLRSLARRTASAEEARDTLRRVEAAVLRLRPKTREIFMAHRVEGLSYAEIAQRTGLSVKGVEKQMSKAIAAIDRTLDRA